MLEFLADNIGTIVIGLVLLVVIILVIRKLVKDRKNGSACSCGCGCKDCPSSSLCHKK
ncbi:FeoB-associated Cys-rich membrane protein [Massiliimalia timonensis]|uniref:FeoB-associated Cys-rich membrane protein n=1 Tax=Massiliimalia timonensis TaxID=1987501 RepID=A0A8J6NZ19_9FIRM|nr:FeoB-associated Cys-rich membrane protein [Massiliimalia timonensis]MBC8609544.1 FeoB-associated Cys-rich membrane protein [Massiliimalia timonensis]MBS7176623.1 FeoB-associated Cys-rich membrane protein [Clostridiales bacterium]